MSSGYDFGALYGMADHSSITPLEPGSYDAIVEEAVFGRTKDGTKGAWTITFRTTTGDRAGYKLTMTLSINPNKTDGSPNPQGMGIMFRQLAAMGVPIGPPHQEPGIQPFWTMGWDENYVAQFIKGKPVLLSVYSDEYDGTTRSKVKDIKAPRPGAPLTVQQPPQVQQQAAYGYAQQPPQPGYGQPQMQPNGYAQQPAGQPGYGYAGQQAPAPQPPQPQGPVAPGPWQNAQPQAGGQAPIPGAPAWAQPPVPGQGGQGEFTAQGQSYQGYAGQAPPQQGTPPQGGQPQQWAPQQPPQGQVPPGGGAQPQGGTAWQGTPQSAPGQAPASPSSPQQGQAPQQGAPDLPPWAQ